MGQASGLIPAGRGITVAGQRRNLTGFAGLHAIPGFPGQAYHTAARAGAGWGFGKEHGRP